MAPDWRSRLKSRISRSPRAQRLGDLVPQDIEHRILPFIFRASVHHHHGPRKIPYSADELIVLSVVRNGALHVNSLFRPSQL